MHGIAPTPRYTAPRMARPHNAATWSSTVSQFQNARFRPVPEGHPGISMTYAPDGLCDDTLAPDQSPTRAPVSIDA